jgi:5-methylcytosine-specific restriction enzyme A
MTGPTASVRALVIAREQGCCARCSRPGDNAWPPHQVHHRRCRGMGSTRRPESNGPANLLLLCDACHRGVESYRALALADGLLVRQSHDPAAVPVRYRGAPVLLHPDGTLTPTEDR